MPTDNQPKSITTVLNKLKAELHEAMANFHAKIDAIGHHVCRST